MQLVPVAASRHSAAMWKNTGRTRRSADAPLRQGSEPVSRSESNSAFPNP